MINNIRLLRNIGQFDSVETAATIPLARVTLIYSENGRGKTTIAAVLRSLATGDPIPIAERRRLGAAHPPHVVLECTGGPPPAVFENNTWNRTTPNLVVFDDIFVDENVHSGLAVGPHHRQNLHEFILGAQAVTLSNQLQDLVDEIEVHNTKLRDKGGAIPATDRGPYSIDDFCALAARTDIDEAIRDAERALAAAQEQEAIRTTLPFETIYLLGLDLAQVDRILAEDLPALDAAVLAQTEAHLATLGAGGEPWVAEGMRIVQERDNAARATCPFCGQDLEGSPILAHFRAYFSDAYTALRRRIADTIAQVRRAHGGDVPAGFERSIRVTVERRAFWSRFCDVPEVAVDTAAIVRDWSAARDAILSQLEAKQAAPLERMSLTDEVRFQAAALDAHRQSIEQLSDLLQRANEAVKAVKERAGTANAARLADDLARLKAVKARHTPNVNTLCDDYLREKAAKRATEQRRDQAKNALEQYRQTVFPRYQTDINVYLANFNADFRLASVRYADTRGGPSCTYNVVINNTPIPIGSEPTRGEPSFRNTLSAGDRSTLALAFFFTSLHQDPELASRVVVIDDPISSLDEHRAWTTIQQIRRLAQRTAQVIVLSHNRQFLCRLWDAADRDERAALEVVRDGAGSTLREWDVSSDSISEHDRRHALLRDFFESGTGDRREVARAIRPHLEAFLRVAYPDQFRPGTLLGQFLGACRQANGTPQEALDAAKTQDLREIVDYANRFHHDTNPAWETEVINAGELRGFVERALRFVRK